MTTRSKNGNGRASAPTTGRITGYARVSTGSQSLDGQLATLKAAGAATIYRETISGARSDRPQLQRLLVRLTPGDVLLVTRLDRLARSTRDLLNVLDTVAKAGASFRSIGDAWCDTTTPHGRLMLTVLGGLAEFERELIRERAGEGRRRAMAAGVRFGRPPVLTAFQKAEAYKRRKACLVPERPHWRATVSDRASLSRQRQHHRKAIAMTKREVPAPADPRHLHRG